MYFHVFYFLLMTVFLDKVLMSQMSRSKAKWLPHQTNAFLMNLNLNMDRSCFRRKKQLTFCLANLLGIIKRRLIVWEFVLSFLFLILKINKKEHPTLFWPKFDDLNTSLIFPSPDSKAAKTFIKNWEYWDKRCFWIFVQDFESSEIAQKQIASSKKCERISQMCKQRMN